MNTAPKQTNPEPLPRNQGPFTDTYTAAERLTAQGNQIVYRRTTLFPVLEANVILRERSREQLGEIEKTILRVIAGGVSAPATLSQLIGISLSRLQPLLNELHGRSLTVFEAESGLALTPLGDLSLQHGVQVVDAKRALLLCGLTGRLMPRGAYESVRLQPADLQKRIRYNGLVEESQEISLSALNISEIKDKRAVNLPDEAIEFVDLVSYQPRFIECIVILYRTDAGSLNAEVHIGDIQLDWVGVDSVITGLEPLGYGDDAAPSHVLNNVRIALETAGVVVSGAGRLDHYGNPVFTIKKLVSRTLRAGGKPLFLYIGTDRNAAIPVSSLRGIENILNGRTITLISANEVLSGEVDCIRCVDRAIAEYYAVPAGKRSGTCRTHVESRLEAEGFKATTTEYLVHALDDRRFKKVFSETG